MKRRFFNFLSLVSLALALASAALWVRSHYVNDAIGFEGHYGFALATFRGSAAAAVIDDPSDHGSFYERNTPEDVEGDLARFGTYRHLPGVSYVSFGKLPGTVRLIAMSFWILIPLFLVAPTCWICKRRLTETIGLCKMCGYDLRASPERCPECGVSVARNRA